MNYTLFFEIHQIYLQESERISRQDMVLLFYQTWSMKLQIYAAATIAEKKAVSVKSANVSKYLGPERFTSEIIKRTSTSQGVHGPRQVEKFSY